MPRPMRPLPITARDCATVCRILHQPRNFPRPAFVPISTHNRLLVRFDCAFASAYLRSTQERTLGAPPPPGLDGASRKRGGPMKYDPSELAEQLERLSAQIDAAEARSTPEVGREELREVLVGMAAELRESR